MALLGYLAWLSLGYLAWLSLAYPSCTTLGTSGAVRAPWARQGLTWSPVPAGFHSAVSNVIYWIPIYHIR